MRTDEVPKNVQNRLEMLGNPIRRLLRDEEDPAVVCAVLSANLDTWAQEHGYDASNLATAIAIAVIHHTEDRV
jgi:hypothetical protein